MSSHQCQQFFENGQQPYNLLDLKLVHYYEQAD